MTHSQDMALTIAGIIIGLGLAWLCYKLHMKKRDGFKAPLIPWILPSIALLATAFILLVHLVNLFGFETGR